MAQVSTSDPLHVVHLEGGHFSTDTETQATDLDRLFDNCFSALPSSGLAIHFHGGLVPRKAGKAIAKDLCPKYQDAGAYPVFFVWESGAVETVVNNLRDIAQEPIFRELLRKAIEFALGRLGDAIGGKGAAPVAVDPAAVTDALDNWFSNPTGVPPFADYSLLTAQDGGKAAAVPDMRYESQIQANLESDPRFRSTLQAVSNGLLPATDRVATRGGGTRGATTTLMDPATLDEAIETAGPGERGLISMAKMAKLLAKAVFRVASRFIAGRDHGLYGTVVEEVLRGFYGDKIGQSVFWNQMKKDTADAFDPTPAPPGREAGGRAFLERLASRLADGSPVPRITLTGHSTGAIYICNFIKCADELLPASIRFDIVLLAPAVDFKAFARTVQDYPHRIGQVRLFGMQDALERDDAMAQGFLGKTLARVVYPHSLLYFVSGLLEGDEVDMPILGMRRFYDHSQIFSAPDYPEVDWARSFFAQSHERCAVWSEAKNGPPGHNSSARTHSDFDNDDATVKSIQHLLRHGFD